jgi:hypothetical protein
MMTTKKTLAALLSVAILSACWTLLWTQNASAAVHSDQPPKASYGATNVLNSAATKAFTALLGRNTYSIQNLGPNDMFCGFDSAVTANTGTKVAASGGFMNIDIADGRDIWCLASTADQTSPNNTRWMQVK